MANPIYLPVSNPFSAGSDFPSTVAGVTLPGGVAGVFCDYPHQVTAEFETQVVRSWSGYEKRSAKQARILRFRLQFEQIPPVDGDTLYNHFCAQLGRLHSFSYFDYLSGEEFTVRYDKDMMSRETYLFDAERVGVELVVVL